MTTPDKIDELLPFLNTRVTRDLYDAVKAHAAAEDRSVSWVIRKALRDYLEAQEGQSPA